MYEYSLFATFIDVKNRYSAIIKLMMRNLKNHLLKHTKRAKHVLGKLPSSEKFLHKNVPYFSQWESRNLNKDILEEKISAKDDPKWKDSGAATKDEYLSWSWSGCGMACTKMLLAHRQGKVIPLVKLGKLCADYGGYTFPLETSPGMYYKPYIPFVKEEFGWEARIASGMIIPEIMHELGKGNFIIASVHPAIRTPEAAPKTKNGHLILLLGYNKAKREIYFHNPSGISAATQEYAVISFKDFKKFFSGRGIVVQG